MSGKKTLDQERAHHAWTTVEDVKGLSEAEKKQFGTQAKKLPTRIIAAGVGQALAFLLAKSQGDSSRKPGLCKLQDALSDWMAARRSLKSGEDERLLVRLLQGDADFQRYATAECLAYLVWLVRFADAAGLTSGGEE